MLLRSIMAVISLLGTISAQTSPCPIQITELRQRAHNTNWNAVLGTSDDELDKSGYGMKVQFVNLSEKTIKAAEFSMVMYDGVDRERESIRSYVMTKRAKPSQKVTQFFLPPEFSAFAQVNRRRGIAVWATRVLFEDDSVWDSNGTRECFARSRR